ncbi:hypothetical protein HDU96_007732 [Phlyctochytrium bullatum]|nr:hypothetical protein HDU96_007732 [Phlyctochytrium bullatum]
MKDGGGNNKDGPGWPNPKAEPISNTPNIYNNGSREVYLRTVVRRSCGRPNWNDVDNANCIINFEPQAIVCDLKPGDYVRVELIADNDATPETPEIKIKSKHTPTSQPAPTPTDDIYCRECQSDTEITDERETADLEEEIACPECIHDSEIRDERETTRRKKSKTRTRTPKTKTKVVVSSSPATVTKGTGSPASTTDPPSGVDGNAPKTLTTTAPHSRHTGSHKHKSTHTHHGTAKTAAPTTSKPMLSATNSLPSPSTRDDNIYIPPALPISVSFPTVTAPGSPTTPESFTPGIGGTSTPPAPSSSRIESAGSTVWGDPVSTSQVVPGPPDVPYAPIVPSGAAKDATSSSSRWPSSTGGSTRSSEGAGYVAPSPTKTQNSGTDADPPKTSGTVSPSSRGSVEAPDASASSSAVTGISKSVGTSSTTVDPDSATKPVLSTQTRTPSADASISNSQEGEYLPSTQSVAVSSTRTSGSETSELAASLPSGSLDTLYAPSSASGSTSTSRTIETGSSSTGGISGSNGQDGGYLPPTQSVAVSSTRTSGSESSNPVATWSSGNLDTPYAPSTVNGSLNVPKATETLSSSVGGSTSNNAGTDGSGSSSSATATKTSSPAEVQSSTGPNDPTSGLKASDPAVPTWSDDPYAPGSTRGAVGTDANGTASTRRTHASSSATSTARNSTPTEDQNWTVPTEPSGGSKTSGSTARLTSGNQDPQYAPNIGGGLGVSKPTDASTRPVSGSSAGASGQDDAYASLTSTRPQTKTSEAGIGHSGVSALVVPTSGAKESDIYGLVDPDGSKTATKSGATEASRSPSSAPLAPSNSITTGGIRQDTSVPTSFPLGSTWLDPTGTMYSKNLTDVQNGFNSTVSAGASGNQTDNGGDGSSHRRPPNSVPRWSATSSSTLSTSTSLTTRSSTKIAFPPTISLPSVVPSSSHKIPTASPKTVSTASAKTIQTTASSNKSQRTTVTYQPESTSSIASFSSTRRTTSSSSPSSAWKAPTPTPTPTPGSESFIRATTKWTSTQSGRQPVQTSSNGNSAAPYDPADMSGYGLEYTYDFGDPSSGTVSGVRPSNMTGGNGLLDSLSQQQRASRSPWLATQNLSQGYQIFASILIFMAIIEYLCFIGLFLYSLVQGVRKFARPVGLTGVVGTVFVGLRSMFIPLLLIQLTWLPGFGDKFDGDVALGMWRWLLVSFWVGMAIYLMLLLIPVGVLVWHAIVAKLGTKATVAVGAAGAAGFAEKARDVIVVIPVYNELPEVLLQTVISVVESKYPKNKMSVILAMDDPHESALYLQTRKNLDPTNKAIRTPGVVDFATHGFPMSMRFRDVTVTVCRFEHRGKRHTQSKAFDLIQHVYATTRRRPSTSSALKAPSTNVKAEAKEPLIMFIDSDIVLEPLAMRSMANELTSNGKAAVTGMILCSNPSFNPWWILQDIEYVQGQYMERLTESYCGGVTCLPGALTMVRMDVLQRIAPKYFHTPEDPPSPTVGPPRDIDEVFQAGETPVEAPQSAEETERARKAASWLSRRTSRYSMSQASTIGPAGDGDGNASNVVRKMDMFTYALLFLGEDRFFTRLLLEEDSEDWYPGDVEAGGKEFTGPFSVTFTDKAVCRTVAPDTFEVFVKQRRRWFLGTVANEACLLCSPVMWSKYPLLTTLRLLFVSFRSVTLLTYVLLFTIIILAVNNDPDFQDPFTATVPAAFLVTPLLINWACFSVFAIKLRRVKLFLYPVFYVLHPFIAWIITIYSVCTILVRSWGGPRVGPDRAETVLPHEPMKEDQTEIMAMYSEDYNKTVYRGSDTICPLILPPPPLKSSMAKNPRFVESSPTWGSAETADTVETNISAATEVTVITTDSGRNRRVRFDLAREIPSPVPSGESGSSYTSASSPSNVDIDAVLKASEGREMPPGAPRLVVASGTMEDDSDDDTPLSTTLENLSQQKLSCTTTRGRHPTSMYLPHVKPITPTEPRIEDQDDGDQEQTPKPEANSNRQSRATASLYFPSAKLETPNTAGPHEAHSVIPPEFLEALRNLSLSNEERGSLATLVPANPTPMETNTGPARLTPSSEDRLSLQTIVVPSPGSRNQNGRGSADSIVLPPPPNRPPPLRQVLLMARNKSASTQSLGPGSFQDASTPSTIARYGSHTGLAPPSVGSPALGSATSLSGYATPLLSFDADSLGRASSTSALPTPKISPLSFDLNWGDVDGASQYELAMDGGSDTSIAHEASTTEAAKPQDENVPAKTQVEIAPEKTHDENTQAKTQDENTPATNDPEPIQEVE